MHEQIDLKKVLIAVKGNFVYILVIIFLFVGMMFVYLTYFTTPIYQKNTQILVNQSEKKASNGLEAQTVQADLQLVNTYSTIITSPRILEKVGKKMNYKYDVQELADMIKVNNTTNSQLIDISVDYEDPLVASKIANLTAQIFTEDIQKIMNIDNVTIISPSSYTGEETPIRPQKALMLLLSFFLGLVVAFLFIVIKMFFERTFTSIKEIEELLGLPILGEVSTFQKEELYLTEKEDLLRK